MGFFKQKNEETEIAWIPEVSPGDIVLVTSANGYSGRFLVAGMGVRRIGYEGFSKHYPDDSRLSLVKVNDRSLADAVKLEEQIRDEASGRSASNDAPCGE